MAKDNITPEERLLKIIENPNTQRRHVPLSSKVKSINVKSIKDWFNNFHIDKSKFKQIDLKLINKAAAVICALITFIWIFDFAYSSLKLNSRFKQIASGSFSFTAEEKKQPKIDVSIDEATAQVNRRNMFTFLPTKEEVASTVSVGQTLSNFKLVGILWSDNPQAMIENSGEQKTYFVSKGDTISDIEVRKILRDKVIVGKGDQEWELR